VLCGIEFQQKLFSRPFRNFVGPDPKAREGIGAKHCCDRDIRRIAFPRQQNQADSRNVVPRIERPGVPKKLTVDDPTAKPIRELIVPFVIDTFPARF
jgi:hypothetical protein